jgi:hypothetical protein
VLGRKEDRQQAMNRLRKLGSRKQTPKPRMTEEKIGLQTDKNERDY